MNEPKKKLSRAGKRQIVLLTAIALLIVAVLMLVMKVAESNAPPPRTPQAKTQTHNITAPGAISDETAAQVTDRRLAEFQAMLRAQEQEQAKRLREASEKAREEERQRQERENGRRNRTGGSSASADDGDVEDGNLKLFDPSKMGQNSRRSENTFNPAVQVQPQVVEPRVRTLTFSEQPVVSTAGAAFEPSSRNSSPAAIDQSGDPADYAAVGRALRGEGSSRRMGQSSSSTDARNAETYLPSGTFFKVSTVNGIDAPAGGQAQNNPQPLLMVVSDWGNMPNSFKADVKHCFVIGSAWGDLSSERAMARTETLSCIRPNGDVIDVPLTGFVVGPDGRNGFRGRVVTKQGQVLANALWTGMLTGFGDVARQMNSTPVIIAGSVANRQSPTAEEVLQRSALGGVGEAAKTLSQYYISLAEKLYPVIETDGGLSAEIVLTRGVAIKRGEKVGTTHDFSNLGQALNRLRQ